MDLSSVKSLNDVPETIRGLFSEKDGVISLDETRVKTAEDVQKVLDAKKHEADDHKATKDRLESWLKFGKTPEEIQSILDEYPALKETGAKSNTDYLNEKTLRTQKERELAELTEKLKAEKKTNAELNGYRVNSIKRDHLSEIKKKLSDYNTDAIDMIISDNIEKFELNDDESGFKTIGDKEVKDFIETRLKILHAEKVNTPSGSTPPDGRHKSNIPAGIDAKFNTGFGLVDDEILKQARK